MGSIGNSARLAAFQSDVFASGLDLRRCEIMRDLGTFKAADSASFEMGMLVSLNSSGEVAKADVSGVLGIAKHNKVSLQSGAIIDEEVTVDAGAVSQLKHANVSNLVVRTAADQGGTAISAAGDYTLSTTNGTLTWDAVPAEVADGQKVYVSYTFAMTEADYRFQGKNFFNGIDDVSVAEGRITVVQGPAKVFTTQFVTSRTYAMNDILYCGGNTAGQEGMFTNDSAGSAQIVGRVIQLPTADDPFLGVEFAPELG